MIQGFSEGLVLANKLGLKKEQILQMMSESAINTLLLQVKKNMFLNEDFPAAFALELMTKDLRLALEAASIKNTPLPVASNESCTLEVLSRLSRKFRQPLQ